jgi:hypothetical protein
LALCGAPGWKKSRFRRVLDHPIIPVAASLTANLAEQREVLCLIYRQHCRGIDMGGAIAPMAGISAMVESNSFEMRKMTGGVRRDMVSFQTEIGHLLRNA